MTLKVHKIEVSVYGSKPDGTVTLSGDEGYFNLKLSESAAFRMQALAMELFIEQQAALAKSVAEVKFPALAAPDVPEAEFDEVPF